MLFSSPLWGACQPVPTQPTLTALGSKCTFTTKEQQVLCASAKGMSHFPKLLLFTETLNFHIFTKFYLYIRCANELISRVNKEPVTHPRQTFQRPYPLFPTPAVVRNEHLLSTRHHSATHQPFQHSSLQTHVSFLKAKNVLNIHHQWCSIRIN